MALTQCKECSKEISDKTEKCPNCGAKTIKKRSKATWALFITIASIVFIWDSYNKEESKTIKTTSNTIKTTSNTIKTTNNTKTTTTTTKQKKLPQWQNTESTNPATQVLNAYALSPEAAPMQSMKFPYTNTKAQLAAGCNNKSEWIYFNFSASPNLTNDETKDGYNKVTARIRWDDQLQKTALTQEWGASSLHFSNTKKAFNNTTSSKKAILELHWHGQNTVFFEFNLNGSKLAIKKMKARCQQTKS